MEFKIDRNVFVKALKPIYDIATKTELKAIVLLADKQGTITLMCSDSEKAVKRTLTGNVISDGEVAIDAKKLHDIIETLPNEEIHFQESEKNCMVKCHKSKFKIPTMVCLQEIKDTIDIAMNITPLASFNMVSETLYCLIDETAFCASDDETKGVFMGILLDIDPNRTTDSIRDKSEKPKVRGVASNGHGRLLVNDKEISDLVIHHEMFDDIVVPAKLAADLKKLFKKDQSIINVKITHNMIQFSEPECIVSFRLMEGSYPDYSGVINFKDEAKLEVDRTNLYNAIKHIIAGSDNAFMKVTINDNNLTLKSVYIEGEGSIVETELEFTLKDGAVPENYMAAFPPAQIVDILKHMSTDNVALMIQSGLSPLRLQGNIFAMIMPCRIPEID